MNKKEILKAIDYNLNNASWFTPNKERLKSKERTILAALKYIIENLKGGKK